MNIQYAERDQKKNTKTKAKLIEKEKRESKYMEIQKYTFYLLLRRACFTRERTRTIVNTNVKDVYEYEMRD